MIGVNVRVEDVIDLDPGCLGGLKISVGISQGIDDRSGLLAAAANEVGDSDRIGMEKLTENHGVALPAKE
jgi:hypothetical protein